MCQKVHISNFKSSHRLKMSDYSVLPKIFLGATESARIYRSVFSSTSTFLALINLTNLTSVGVFSGPTVYHIFHRTSTYVFLPIGLISSSSTSSRGFGGLLFSTAAAVTLTS